MVTKIEAKEKQVKLREQVNAWKKQHPEWRENRSIKKLESMVAKTTFWGYTSMIPVFCYWIDHEPDELIELRRTQRDSDDPDTRNYFETKMWEFREFLMSHHYTPKSVKQRLAKISGFFSNNNEPLRLPTMFWRKAEESSELGEALTITKRPPDNDEIRLMTDFSNPRETSILLLGYQSGLTPIDITQLRWERLNLDLDTSPMFTFFMNNRSKTKEDQVVVLNPDLQHYLRLVWIEQDRPVEGWVFAGQRDDSHIATSTINMMWNRITEKALGGKRADQIRFKDLRDAFNTAIIDSEVAQEVKDRLMGHKLDSARGAYEYSEASIVRIYEEKIFPRLAINGWRQQRKASEVEELEIRVETLSYALNKVEEENTAYKTRLDNLQQIVTSLKEDFNLVLKTLKEEPDN